MKNIYYYDNSAAPYEKLGNRISEMVVELQPDVNIFYIYDGYNKTSVNLGISYRDNVTILDSKKVHWNLRKFPADCFVCYGQPSRIPDAYWTLFFNKLKVPTIRVQHGLFIKDYIRTGGFFKSEVRRSFYYGFYLILIFLGTRLGMKKKTCLELINKQIKISSNDNLQVDNRIGSENVIIWGDYWKSWFKSYPHYDDNNKYLICGGFDFELLKKPEKLIKPQKKSIVYICQTLIEDGRLESEIFLDYLEKLYECAKNFEGDFYLKLHPRSDLSLYEAFQKLDNVITTHKFPIGDIYISHYSSLLSVSAYLKKKILLVQFPGHEIPEAFEHMAKNVINYDEEIKIDEVKEFTVIDTDKYYKYHEEPYREIANHILNIGS